MSNAVRQRRYRERKRKRKPECPSWCDPDEDVFFALDYMRWLKSEDAEDKAKLRAAINRILRDWAHTNCPFLS